MGETLLAVLVGGFLATMGSFVVAWVQDRRHRSSSASDRRLAAAGEVLGSIQELNRRLIDVARVESHDHHHQQWTDLHVATIRWNSARLAAGLIAPANEIDWLNLIDVETDRVMDAALAKRWESRDFRTERAPLGELGARYLNLVRSNEKLTAISIESLWPWRDHNEN